MKKLYMYLTVSLLCTTQLSAQNLFNQDFSDGTTLTTYYNATEPGVNQLNNIIPGANNTASITSDGVKLSKSASAAAIIRSTSLSDDITFLKFQTRIRLSYNNDMTVTTGGSFQIAFGDNSTNANAWGPYNSSTVGNADAFVSYAFALDVDDVNKTAAYKYGLNGSLIYGWEDITIFCNYTDGVVSYTNPAGEQSSVQPKSSDLWLGTTRVKASYVLVNTMRPNKFKITMHQTAHSVDMEVDYIKIWDQNGLTLPVTMKNFDGSQQGNGVKLNWSTASEKNNSHFEILKSTDGNVFSTLATIQGNGNTESISNYQYIDAAPSIGTNYYKLKQFDSDGKSEEFNQIVAVKYGMGTDDLIAYYNDGSLNVKYTPKEKIAELKLIDISGKCIKEWKLDGKVDNGFYELPVNLRKGMYLVVIKDGAKHNSIKMLN